jgi:hypothetical protein
VTDSVRIESKFRSSNCQEMNIPMHPRIIEEKAKNLDRYKADLT